MIEPLSDPLPLPPLGARIDAQARGRLTVLAWLAAHPVPTFAGRITRADPPHASSWRDVWCGNVGTALPPIEHDYTFGDRLALWEHPTGVIVAFALNGSPPILRATPTNLPLAPVRS